MSYKIRKITFLSNQIPIILQNKNGPCPLIALANVLLLRGSITLPLDKKSIKNDELYAVVSEHLLQKQSERGIDENFEKNMNDCITIFPKLSAGLDVNVKFGSINGFEYTNELIVFDILDIKLVHGWLVSPEAPNYEVITKYSYNKAMETIILMRNILNGSVDGKEDVDVITKDGAILESWVEENQSQLTYQGIIQLHQLLGEYEPVVLFRNNHFSTIVKYEGRLFTLVTDEGYRRESNVVWEDLTMVDGDSQFFDSNFNLYVNGKTIDINNPEQFLMQEQEEEDAKIARQLHYQLNKPTETQKDEDKDEEEDEDQCTIL